MEHPDSDLQRLAAACGVMTSYSDWLERRVAVSAESVRLALAGMGVPAQDCGQVRQSLGRIREQKAARLLPATVVVATDSDTRVPLPDSAGRVDAALFLADGAVGDVKAGAGGIVVPSGLPLGYHRLTVATATVEQSSTVAVVPGQCPLPLLRPSWGWMVQLYAARSRRSWGMGDFGDLRALGDWAGRLGAAMLLVNPLHAAAPGTPQENSPYFPASRRYRNPLYLRIEDLPELASLGGDDRIRVAELGRSARDGAPADRIDRDAVYTAKQSALELLAAVRRPPEREQAYRTWREAEGQGIVNFATYCALAERHGRDWKRWPEALRHPAADRVATARRELGDRVEYHTWLQWLCDTQLQAAQEAATGAGMAVGVIHDLAVGVDPSGADGWALQDDLAVGVTVGAPPDGFNQKGQDWSLPPLLPGRLVETGYAPFRDMLHSVLRHAGGIRIDHVMGLWRLWWVPEGRPASEGTYVRYPASDLLGVLALEATRAGALVVGEDLGTVERGVRQTLADRRVLSSRVAYFEHIDDDPAQPLLPAADYPRLALTSITTHDLPTPAGWWADEDVRVQTELGLFGDNTTPREQAERKATERAEMLVFLRRQRLLSAEGEPSAAELVEALHAFLARTPSLLIASGLGDALGDRRQPNMPGTTDEYPNWRLPLARWTPAGAQPVLLDEILSDAGVLAVARVLDSRR